MLAVEKDKKYMTPYQDAVIYNYIRIVGKENFDLIMDRLGMNAMDLYQHNWSTREAGIVMDSLVEMEHKLKEKRNIDR